MQHQLSLYSPLFRNSRQLLKVCLLAFGALSTQHVLAQGSPAAPAVQQQELRVNVNEADAELIADILVGIGPSRARAIVEYREAHGRFETLEDLTRVSGVGESTVMNNQDRISFE